MFFFLMRKSEKKKRGGTVTTGWGADHSISVAIKTAKRERGGGKKDVPFIPRRQEDEVGNRLNENVEGKRSSNFRVIVFLGTKRGKREGT